MEPLWDISPMERRPLGDSTLEEINQWIKLMDVVSGSYSWCAPNKGGPEYVYLFQSPPGLLIYPASCSLNEEDPERRINPVQSLSCVELFVTPWTAACQDSLYITNFQSLFKLTIELVMPSNHLLLYSPLLLLPSIFPSIRVFANESVLCINGQSIGASASVSILPTNIQGWFALRLTGLISLQSKGFSRVSSNTTVQKHQFFST